MIQIFRKNLNKFIFPTLIVAGLFLPISKTYAQGTFQSIFREIAGKISTLLTIKKDTELSPEEKLQQEMQAREEAIQKIFDLTKLEQADLLNRLSSLKDLNEQQKNTAKVLTNLVKENKNGLDEIQSRLDSAENLDDIKQLAADFNEWRTLVYNPKTEKVVAFTFTFQGKNILLTTNERLNKVRADLENYQNSLKVQDKKADEIFRKAESNIKEAEDLNGQARNIIMLALNKPLPLPKNQKTFEKETARDISDSKAFTEKSMQYVRSAYDEFLELGKIINNEQ